MELTWPSSGAASPERRAGIQPAGRAQCRLLSISRPSLHYTPQGGNEMNLDLMLLIDKQQLLKLISADPRKGILSIRSSGKASRPFRAWRRQLNE